MLKSFNYERQDEISRYIEENKNAFVGTESHRILNKIVELRSTKFLLKCYTSMKITDEYIQQNK